MDLFEGNLMTTTLKNYPEDAMDKSAELKDTLKSRSAKGLYSQHSQSKDRSTRRQVVRVTSGDVLRASADNTILPRQAIDIVGPAFDSEDVEKHKQFQNMAVKQLLQSSKRNIDQRDDTLQDEEGQHHAHGAQPVGFTLQTRPNEFSYTTYSERKVDIDLS